MTIPMAIIDFVPVLMFLCSAVLLQRDLYNKMSKGAFAIFAAGTIMISVAGICKAVWKLLYILNICDFDRLNQMFFPLQGIGFLLTGIALIAMLTYRQGTVLAVSPALFSGTMIFVGMICFGVLGINISLAVVAGRIKKKGLIPVFILAAIGMLGMGYLSTRDFSNPAMHWAAELTNVAAQGLFLLGVALLHKADLRNASIKRK